MISFVRQRISIKYFLVTACTIAAVFAVMFVWISGKQERLILKQIEKQAVILHRQIVLTRQWVSDHGYVLIAGKEGRGSDYVFMEPGMEDITGKVYTRVTPAAMTRRLSDYASKDRLYSFNLTNLDALNPDNVPDAFEVDAIHRFRSGQTEGISRVERHQGEHVFRYAAPLVVQESCLACHKGKAVKVGGIGGCISVFIPFEESRRAIRRENLSLFLAMLGLTVSVVVILFLATQKLLFRPLKEIRSFTRQMQEEAFNEHPAVEGDELTELAGLCYRMDERLKNEHTELERKIAEATADLSRTNAELEEGNRRLTALNTAKNEYLTDISHELRTPLTAIKGAADILSRKTACDNPAYLDIIRKNTDQLIRTLVDFLDFSKIESGRLELEYEAASIQAIAEEVFESGRTMADKKGVRLERVGSVDETLPMDRWRIRQVLVNLMDNALKFSPENGRIRLRMHRRDGWLQVSMADDGPGIPEAHREMVFQKYFQAPRTVQVPSAGSVLRGSSGIGLAICRGIVEAHGGSIHAERSDSGGSRFVFTLPTGRTSSDR